MEPRIVNPDPKYSTVKLIEPSPLGYILLAAQVRPRPVPPQLPAGRERTELVRRLKGFARQLERLDAVEKVTVFDAVVIPPPVASVRARAGADGIARFDVVTLVETATPEAARDVRATAEYRALEDALRARAQRMYVVVARNVKRIADVDKTRQGLFLFNYFVADDADTVVRLWDYLADWYEVETGLDNSTLLVPLEGEPSDYVAVNHARWDMSLPRFLARQMSKKSFRTYVLANLEANHVGSMPILYRLA